MDLPWPAFHPGAGLLYPVHHGYSEQLVQLSDPAALEAGNACALQAAYLSEASLAVSLEDRPKSLEALMCAASLTPCLAAAYPVDESVCRYTSAAAVLARRRERTTFRACDLCERNPRFPCP